MTEIDWLNTPLAHFSSKLEPHPEKEGLYRSVPWPYGEGTAQDVMFGIACDIDKAYEELLGDSEEAIERLERTGEVEVIRGTERGYEPLDSLTLADLPDVLNTLVVLEAEHNERMREASEQKAAERKERDRVRAKERRKLKKLGEW